MEQTRLPLSPDEKSALENFQTKVHQVIIDLGKIELQLSDLHSVKEQVKQVMTQIVADQNQYFADLEEKYGKGGVDPKSFEYILSEE
jgi:flagellar biosynthesis chaperone FliJ